MEHNSVLEMIKHLSDPEFAKELEQFLEGRMFIKTLVIARIKLGLNQGQMAKKLGWSQSKTSKIESKSDCDIKFGEMLAYATAVGLNIGFIPK